MLHYIDLRSVSPQVKALDLEFISQRLTATRTHVMAKDVKDYIRPDNDKVSSSVALSYGKSLEMWHIDYNANALWAHLGIAWQVCSILGVPVPKEHIDTQIAVARDLASRLVEKRAGDPKVVEEAMRIYEYAREEYKKILKVRHALNDNPTTVEEIRMLNRTRWEVGRLRLLFDIFEFEAMIAYTEQESRK